MNVVACLARVPDTASRIKPGSDGKSPDLEGAQFVVNPYDEFALEEAVKLREAKGSSLLAIHVGPVDFQKELRNALAKGADKAIQLSTTGPLGPAGISKLLAEQIRPLLPATVFLGKQSVDGDVGATGAFLGNELGLPVVSKISTLKIEGDRFSATREVEGGVETIEGALPCIFTAEKGLNEPRRAGLNQIMAAKKKPLTVETKSAPPPLLDVLALELPKDRPAGRMLGEGVGAVAALVTALQNEAKVL
jgi:electron transfer flavoprotein beta subunit